MNGCVHFLEIRMKLGKHMNISNLSKPLLSKLQRGMHSNALEFFYGVLQNETPCMIEIQSYLRKIAVVKQLE